MQDCWYCSLTREARHTHLAGGIDNTVLVQAKHVARAQAGGVVLALAPIGHRVAHQLANVFDDICIGLDGLVGHQAPPVQLAAPGPQVGRLRLQRMRRQSVSSLHVGLQAATAGLTGMGLGR